MFVNKITNMTPVTSGNLMCSLSLACVGFCDSALETNCAQLLEGHVRSAKLAEINSLLNPMNSSSRSHVGSYIDAQRDNEVLLETRSRISIRFTSSMTRPVLVKLRRTLADLLSPTSETDRLEGS